MKIILLGAGSVGISLAEQLAHEDNDIIIVDQNDKSLRELQDRLDVATVCGHASHPNILKQAGAEDADLLIAVTDNDEINMLTCQLAYTLFRVPTKICRVRSKSYLAHEKIFADEAIPIDVLISPETLVTTYVRHLLELPGSLQVVDFANDLVRMVAVKAYKHGEMIGKALNQLPKNTPGIDSRVAGIYRRGTSLIPEGDAIIEENDEVFFIAATEHIPPIMAKLRGQDKPYHRVFIAGGSHIGSSLAQAIESNYQVKIIDKSLECCEQLSRSLHHAIVLHGNPGDRSLLLAEDIDYCDVFCALTDDDEDNIMSALLAKRLGAKKVICLISNIAYADLMQGGDIDITISPQQATIGSVLKHVRSADMANIYSLRRGAAEAIEVIAHGDKDTSQVVGRRLGAINLPSGVTFGALVRDNEVIIAHSNVEVKTGDHVILFVLDKRHIRAIEKLFHVGFTFI